MISKMVTFSIFSWNLHSKPTFTTTEQALQHIEEVDELELFRLDFIVDAQHSDDNECVEDVPELEV